jgi:Condensation domain
MAVMSRCRAENLAVTVQDIMTSKSIPDLASMVTLAEEYDYQEDDEEFDLSPIQYLYFECREEQQAQFNQSMLLYLRQRVQVEDLENAVHELVRTHSMLRVRFSQNKDGCWRQRITKDISGSYKLEILKAQDGRHLLDLMDQAQKSINIVDGPIITVDLFDMGSEQNRLLIAAHHLVVDVVSWNILLQDLEDLLRSKVIQAPSTVSFQNWCRLQKENAQKHGLNGVLPVEDIPTANIAYWGMQSVPNNYGAVVTEEVLLETDMCQSMLSACQGSSQIEVVDVVLAALLISFSRVFRDRATLPAIYNEGHGREPWSSAIDVSRTIGWFTTLTPVHLPRDYDAQEGKILHDTSQSQSVASTY